MSSSQSREWMTSGRPVSRAAAMCWRKPSPALRAGRCRSDSRAPPHRSPPFWDACASATSVSAVDVQSPRARGADGCRPSRTRREISPRSQGSARASSPVSRSSPCARSRPRGRARSPRPARSAKSGKSRWQWLSTSIVKPCGLRLHLARENRLRRRHCTRPAECASAAAPQNRARPAGPPADRASWRPRTRHEGLRQDGDLPQHFGGDVQDRSPAACGSVLASAHGASDAK